MSILITNKELCCGCEACAQVCSKQCITMVADEEGFLYPKVNLASCSNCALCEKVCPVINQNSQAEPLAVHATHYENESIRLKSSSGGIFTPLAEFIIKQGGIVFGARFNEMWEVIHDFTDTLDGIASFRGSKYVQSRIGKTYKQAKQFLKEDRKVLFSGTPCQIAGLKKFLIKDYPNLLTVDIICHGTPSPLVWDLYKRELLIKRKASDFIAISFRNKDKGWQNFSFKCTLCIHQKENEYFRELMNINTYMKGFLKDLYLRPSCHACPAKSLKSSSDITLGDFWGISTLLPEYDDDDKGASLILLNSIKGEQLFHSLPHLKVLKASYIQALKSNSSLTNSVRPHPKRTEFFKTLQTNPSTLHHTINSLTRIPFLTKGKRLIRRILSKIKRTFIQMKVF